MLTRQIDLRDATVTTDAGGRATIEGTAVPYDHTITYAGQAEKFAPGSINAQQVIGRPLMYGHNYQDPAAWMGTITDAENTDTGLLVAAEVVDPDMAAKLRQASQPPGLSVGVTIDHADNEDDGSVTFTAATLRELSITLVPAYGDESMIETVRNRPQEDTTMPETTAPESTAAVDLSGYATREDLAEIEARMHTATQTPARALSVREAFTAQLAGSRDGGRQVRALADVVSSGNAGVLPPDWSSEVRDYVDKQRYAFGMIGTIGFPASGYTLTIPKVLQHTSVAARGTEKTEVESQAFTTGSDTYTADWYAGAVDIALELIYQSDPAVYPLIVDSILSQYAVVTDEALTLAVETAGTPTGAVLDFTDWGTVSAQLIATAETIRAATGEWGDRVMLTTASWQALIGLMDSDGRRLFAPNGPTNADGSAALLSRSINVGGIYCSHNPRSAEDVQTNTKSARVAEKPPTMLTSDNVALMGRDLGVLGATMFVPAYPAGIITHSAAARARRGTAAA